MTQSTQSVDFAQVFQKYADERDKRIAPAAASEYIPISQSPFKHFQDDIWLDTSAPDPAHPALEDGSFTKVLILGAGFGGLYYAVRLIQAGLVADDLRIVDSAGGFGGTWYWNRYPGLMCDVESYIYMPFLEETGYMPKHKYSYGPELRQQAENVAQKWKLHDSTLFRASVTSLTWDENEKNWVAKITRKRNYGGDLTISVRAQFVCAALGILSVPQIPKLAGLESFKGHCFHTSRWDYAYTGGSPTDPSLTNLADKKVGIIGTGATAIQVVPQLAKWAKELYVFQRTPSAVDRRDNRLTDPEWWTKEHQGKKGWQRARAENFNACSSSVSPPPPVDLVDDAWTHMITYGALVGRPNNLTLETIPDHVANLHALDIPRQERIRNRVDEIVTDKDTAAKLKPWYSTWCKRPCFHDDYLPAFNLPNVKLVDTEGRGVDSVTDHSLVVKGEEYNVDVIVFSTGFTSPAGSATQRVGVTVTGRNGLSLDQKWDDNYGSLHGVISRGFPNLFSNGPSQASVSANFSYTIDQLAIHAAYMISTAIQRAGTHHRLTVEPTEEAEGLWTMQCMSGAFAFAALAGCTPSYFTYGRSKLAHDPEAQMKQARKSTWSQGIASYVSVIENWRDEGNMKGLEVKTE